MNRLLLTGIFLLGGYSGMSMAVCTADTQIIGNALTSLISGNPVCATGGAERWQEQHRSGNQLWDFKKAASDPTDQTSQVGTRAITGNDVTYISILADPALPTACMARLAARIVSAQHPAVPKSSAAPSFCPTVLVADVKQIL